MAVQGRRAAIPAMTLPTWAASPSSASPSSNGVMPTALATAAAASSDRCGVAIITFSTPASRGSPGLGVSRAPRPGGGGPPPAPRSDSAPAPPGRRRRCWGRRWSAGSDRRRIVAGHVGDQQAHDLRRVRRGGEPAALDRGEMTADRVHLGDVRTAGEQRLVHRLLVGERQPRGRQRQQGRAAAGDQAQDQIVRAGALGEGQDPCRRGLPGGIRHRVRRLDDLDACAGYGVAVAGDHKPLERPRPVLLDRLGHRGRGLAGAEDDGAPSGWRRQVPRHDPVGERSGDGRIEHRAKQVRHCRLCCGHGTPPFPVQSA